MADFPTTGDDIIFGGSDGDIIDALAGHDTVFGQGGNDKLSGGAGNDRLNGGTGSNDLSGGAGFDTAYYALSIVSMDVSLARGWGAPTGQGAGNIDWYSGIENIEGGAAGDFLTGNRGQNLLYGNGGNDILKGGGGSDALSGGEGDDELMGGTGLDIADGGAGDDQVWGGSGADQLIGGSNGAAGDTLRYDDSLLGVVIDLAANSASGGDAEGDTISGFENIFGSDFGDDLLGSSKANLIWAGNTGDEIEGGGGGDQLYGWGGNDDIRGGSGADVIEGGGGGDDLRGGTGEDVFRYRDASDSGIKAADRDTIRDFTQGEDRIDLSEPLDNFGLFLGTGPFTGSAGVVRYAIANGKTTVFVDIDGDKSADMRIMLIGEFNLTLADLDI